MRRILPVLAAVACCVAAALPRATGQGPAADAGPRLMLSIGHRLRIESCTLSPDGTTLATCGDDSVRLWDLATGQLLRVLPGHDDYARDVAFSPDGKRLASVQRFGRIRLWDPASGREIRSWRDEDFSAAEPTLRFAGTAAEPLLVLTGDGGNAQALVWDPNTGMLVRRIALTFAPGGSGAVAVDPKGRYLAVSSRPAPAERKVAVYDLTTGRQVLDQAGCGAAAFRADGKALLFADRDGALGYRMLDGNDVKNNGRDFFEKGPKDRVTALVPSPDGRLLAARAAGGGVTVWQLDGVGGKILHSWPPQPGAASRAPLTAFTPDGKLLLELEAEEGRNVRLRDVATGTVVRVVAEGAVRKIQTVRFSPDGRSLEARLTEGLPTAPAGWSWDLRTGQATPLRLGEADVLSPDGKTRALAMRTATGAIELRLTAVDGKSEPVPFTLEEVPGTPRTPLPLMLVFSPLGRRLAVRTGPVVAIFDVTTRKRLGEFPPRGDPGLITDFGFTDNLVLLVLKGGTLSAWDLQTRDRLLKVEARWPAAWTPAPGAWLSPDGRFLVGSNRAGTPPRTGFPVTIWDLTTGKEAQRTGEFTATLGWTAFHPDGRSLWMVGDTRGLCRVDLATGKPLYSEPVAFAGGSRTRLAVHPDGKLLAVVEPNGTISLRAIQADTLPRLATLAVVGDKQWALVAENRYDVAETAERAGLHAIRDGQLAAVAEVKEFQREPGLLGRLLRPLLEGPPR